MSWLSVAFDNNRNFIGNLAKNVAPVAGLIPGLGPWASAGIGAAGEALRKGSNVGDILGQGASSGALGGAAGGALSGIQAASAAGDGFGGQALAGLKGAVGLNGQTAPPIVRPPEAPPALFGADAPGIMDSPLLHADSARAGLDGIGGRIAGGGPDVPDFAVNNGPLAGKTPSYGRLGFGEPMGAPASAMDLPSPAAVGRVAGGAGGAGSVSEEPSWLSKVWGDIKPTKDNVNLWSKGLEGLGNLSTMGERERILKAQADAAEYSMARQKQSDLALAGIRAELMKQLGTMTSRPAATVAPNPYLPHNG